MAKRIAHFPDRQLELQLDEILMNLGAENFPGGIIPVTLKSPSGKKFRLVVNDDGVLFTEPIK